MVRNPEELAQKHPLYYEAILQLRDCSPAVVDFAVQEIVRSGARIAKSLDVRNGTDYYLSDSDVAKAVGKKLREQFGGDYKITASLYGQRDGKEIYRLTILFREAAFKKGDMITYDGERYVVQMMGKDIRLQQEKTRKKVRVPYKEMSRIKKAE